MEKWDLAIVELFRGGRSDHTTQIVRLREEMGSRKRFRAFNSWFNKE